MQDFHADEGGVSIVISVLMLLGIFMGAYAMYMSVSLPQEFEAKEKEHMQEVRDSFVELQGAVQQMSAGEARSIGVPMSASLVSGTFRGPNIAGRLRANASLVDGGAVGCWLMDEGSGDNVYDETRYQNHGARGGATWVAGRDNVGMALNFDGIDDNINLGNPSSLQITGNQTIAMWLKPSVLDARRNPYAKAYGGEGTITQEIAGTINYYYGTAGGNAAPYQGFTMTSPISVGQWVHVAIVRDLTNMRLTWYKNGIQTDTTAASYSSATASSLDAFIGRGYVSNYAGVIDEVRIYKRALSADEIKARYQARENYYGRIAFDIQNAYFVPQTYVYEDGAVILVQDNLSSMVSDPPLVAVRIFGDNIEVTLQTVNLLGTSEIITTGTATVTATGDNFQTTAPAAPNLENVTIVVYSIYRDAWKDYLKRLAKGLRDKGIENTVVDLERLQLTIYGKRPPGENDIYFMKRSREAGTAIF